MRDRCVIIVLGMIAGSIGFLWFLPNLVNPQYFGLRHKSMKWYEDFTAACDSVIASHPTGTNEFIRVSVTDPSLPKIITDLHPLKIKVSPQKFWMGLVSDSRDGFGLAWNPKWNDSGIWVLHTTAESLDTVIYSAKR
jgi:hypothetical protein